MQQQEQAVLRAITAAGGQTALAKKVGVSPQAVHRWISQGFVPRGRIGSVAAATGVSVAELALDFVRADNGTLDPAAGEDDETKE